MRSIDVITHQDTCKALSICDRCMTGGLPLCTIPPMGVCTELSDASQHLKISTTGIKALLCCDRVN